MLATAVVLSFATAFSLVAGQVSVQRIGDLVPRVPPSNIIIDAGLRSDLAELDKRLDLAQTFDVGFQALNTPLFSASWSNASTGDIPLPGVVPIEVEGTSSFSFELNCADCRTYGTIVADINDDDGLRANLQFNNVGAYLNFGVVSSAGGTFTVTLGRFLSTGSQAGPTFSAKVGLGLDLVFQFDGSVEATGGFQLSIPNGSQLGFDIDFNLNSSSALKPSASVQTFPNIDFGLLPVALNNTNANVTVALVLRADAGITTAVGPIDAAISAGAHVTLAQVKFGEVSSNNPAQCKIALFADIESNGGAFAQADLSAGPDLAFNEAPEVSTVFATAGTTICLTNTRPALPKATRSSGVPCAMGLTQATTTTTATYSLTSCLVQAVLCPASLAQVIVATNVATVTKASCPQNVTGGVFATVAPITGGITLPPLQAITTTVAPLTFNATRRANATITGKFQTATQLATTRAGNGTVQFSGANPGHDKQLASFVAIKIFLVAVVMFL